MVKERKSGCLPRPLPKGKGFVAAPMHRHGRKETKRGRDKETKRQRDKERKSGREEGKVKFEEGKVKFEEGK